MTRLQELNDEVEAAKARQRSAWADWNERAGVDGHADASEFYARRRETMALMAERRSLRAAADAPAL